MPYGEISHGEISHGGISYGEISGHEKKLYLAWQLNGLSVTKVVLRSN